MNNPTRLETGRFDLKACTLPRYQSPCVLVVGGRFHHSSSRQLRHVVQWEHMIYSVSMLHTNTAGDCLARMVLVTANHNPHACGLLMAGTDLQLDETSFLCGFSSLHYLLHISLCIHQHDLTINNFLLFDKWGKPL
jgi:hypothetical protein